MRRTWVVAATATLLVLATAVGGDAAPKYQPFPSGYGYDTPGEITALKNAVAKGDHKTVRQHGWKLWAGIMQPLSSADPNSWPIWFSWQNTTCAFNEPFCPAQKAPGAFASGAPAGPKKSLMLLNADAGAGQSGGAAIPIPVNVPEVPCYPIPAPVVQAYPTATDPNKCGTNNICDGAHFQFNGDIMIPTESLSQEGFDWIRGKKLNQQATLNALRKQNVKDLTLPRRYVVTKHMFWPVKATGISAVPVWHGVFDPTNPSYQGYETWKDLVGVDPTGKAVGTKTTVSFLYNVLQLQPPPRPSCTNQTQFPTVTASATVYALKDFYSHKVTQADWDSFDDADKAILNASSYWAYNQPFGPGDYLVTIAMHVNTREIPTWALQSAWWSDQPNAGPYAQDRPKLPQAKGPWNHYLLVDAYGIPDSKDRTHLPVATNPYIELVSHPVGTDCNNCHIRSGWPTKPTRPGEQTAGYQSRNCSDLLAALTPGNACFQYLTRSDFQWIIPDRAQ